MNTIKGKIKLIKETQKISDKFQKREFVVLDESGQYAQTILLEATQDRTEILDNFKVHQEVEVTFFIRGREWTNPKDGSVRYFNTLDAWKIEPVTPLDNVPASDNGVDADDSLPF